MEYGRITSLGGVCLVLIISIGLNPVTNIEEQGWSALRPNSRVYSEQASVSASVVKEFSALGLYIVQMTRNAGKDAS